MNVMKFKKVYVEITNMCNLKCPFCNPINRKKEFMSVDNFKVINNNLKKYTDYLYLHVMGEPLLHPSINELIEIAHDNNYYINITTNGYLIDRVKDNKYISQINISLHSFNPMYGKSLEEYLNNIIEVTNLLKEYGTYINYRLWNVSNTKDILDYLGNYYQLDLLPNKNIKIDNQTFISYEEEFIWPDLNNNYYEETGSCRGTIDHIGILVDGTIIPCCLDTNGIINLGNMIDNQIDLDRIQLMQEGFKNNVKVEELCKHCNFYCSRNT